MSNLTKGILAACAVVGLGLLWLYLTMVGPLQKINLGFGLLSGLRALKLPGGYNMASVVLFVIFVILLVVLWTFFSKGKKTG